MNNIKSVFSVKDLENLSGVKAHTIRIWEKRYNLFSPIRDDNNIRSYNTDDLKKILNISYLNNFGYKISKIAKLTESEMVALTQQIYSEKTQASFAISNLKFAMFNFDAKLFHSTYDELEKSKSFEEIFYDVFIPLLDEIGFLWQTETLKPVHEHFISSLIRQKLFSEIEKAQKNVNFSNEEVYVLYLPMHEIHELGIMFVNYLLLRKNKHVIYLGESVPMEDLQEVIKYYNKITFLSYFTVQPEIDNLESYLFDFKNSILKREQDRFYILGKQVSDYHSQIPGIYTFSGIQAMLMTL
ncbi:MerR family transcriptional regulator [Flavobacterium haoranii]|uniref:B12 binding domain-containing protein n=1 Tax=Flavobacterium haoranii TaxID=683124 RepID=A0A1M6BUQ8_9FLAO|nr:MerR family transcriptional regulator [Flavobacterium haoranii]MBD3724217.1 MerR family transcriptional regulator [Flavobacteriaceae bacterium]SHI52387.1 B12 binding domain-containing protein [Flavobacterium haoranii]